MNENTTTSTETEIENQIEGAEDEALEPDEDGWDDIRWGNAEDTDGGNADGEDGESENVEPEADQQRADGTQEPENGAQPAETGAKEGTEGEDQFLDLKYMDQERKVSREEAKILAQKGLDYDRIRGERDSMRQEHGKLKEYESFLNELKGDFPTVEAMITDTRARMIAEKEHIPYADAVAKVKVMHPEQEQKPEAQRGNQPQGNEAVQRFVQLYPGVKAEEIPQSVWDEVKQTGDLVGAYGKYERQKQADKIASLENEIATLKQNQKNAARSTGSVATSGKSASKSLYQQLWDDDDY